MFKELSPRFLKVYLDLTQIIVTVLTQFRKVMELGGYSGQDHCYVIDDEEPGKPLSELRK